MFNDKSGRVFFFFFNFEKDAKTVMITLCIHRNILHKLMPKVLNILLQKKKGLRFGAYKPRNQLNRIFGGIGYCNLCLNLLDTPIL